MYYIYVTCILFRNVLIIRCHKLTKELNDKQEYSAGMCSSAVVMTTVRGSRLFSMAKSLDGKHALLKAGINDIIVM